MSPTHHTTVTDLIDPPTGTWVQAIVDLRLTRPAECHDLDNLSGKLDAHARIDLDRTLTLMSIVVPVPDDQRADTALALWLGRIYHAVEAAGVPATPYGVRLEPAEIDDYTDPAAG